MPRFKERPPIPADTNEFVFSEWFRKLQGFIGVLGLGLTGALYPATPAGADQIVSAIWAGNGVPSNANGSNGDFYFRGDGTQAGNTVIYHKQAGAWVALVTT